MERPRKVHKMRRKVMNDIIYAKIMSDIDRQVMFGVLKSYFFMYNDWIP